MQYIFMNISLGLITRSISSRPTLLLICCCDFGDKSFPRCSLSHATPDAAALLLIPSHPHFELPPSITTLLPHFLVQAGKTLIYLSDVSMVHNEVNAILPIFKNLQLCKECFSLELIFLPGQYLTCTSFGVML